MSKKVNYESNVVIETLPNGLTVIIEEIEGLESVAYDLVIPGGIITDPNDLIGSSLILAELSSRGAGDLNSKALSDAFDQAGIRHSESAGHDRYMYRGSLLADQLESAFQLVSSMILKPTLPEDQIESIQSLLLQDIDSLKDNPARRALLELHEKYYPAPYSRSSMGQLEGIKNTKLNSLRQLHASCYLPKGSILSVAGKCTPSKVLEVANRYFGAWQGKSVSLPEVGKFPAPASFHIEFDSAQLQIALAHPSAPFGDPLYYAAKVALGVLSGGMFGRLFTEVREKRGLCYSVYARHGSTKEYGTVTAYAGTTTDRAQETLDVMLREMCGLKGSISEEEMQRAKANIKSSLVIGEESSAGRASSNSSDYWLDKRIRSLDEVIDAIEGVTLADLDNYLTAYPTSDFMMVTLGAKELQIRS